MEGLKRHWITGLAVVLGVFLLFLAVAIAFENEPTTSGQERAFGVVTMGVAAFALLGGLWFLRSGGLSTRVCLGAIVVGLVGGVVWFWMVIPPLVALVVFWFGIVRGGLVTELRTAPGT
ncbi:MAG: hypothetical protein HKN80_03645 [Acidimicrobiia bacterium]|nr:hypothetical protein [Acidimicrobiia bacterium]